jgi:hypothetical protein
VAVNIATMRTFANLRRILADNKLLRERKEYRPDRSRMPAASVPSSRGLTQNESLRISHAISRDRSPVREPSEDNPQ